MLKRLKIGPKLLVTFLIVAVLSSISGVISLILLKSSDTQYSAALVNYGYSQGDVAMLMNAFTSDNERMMFMLAASDSETMQSAKQTISDNDNVITQYLAAVEPTLTTEQQQGYYDTILQHLPDFKSTMQEFIGLAEKNRDGEGMKFYQQNVSPQIVPIQEAVKGMMDTNTRLGTQISDQLTDTTNFTLFAMTLVVLAAMAISVALSVVVSRSVARPIKACTARIVLLSNGDLATPVPTVNSLDETGVLAGATKELVMRLGTVVSGLSTILGSMAEGNLNVSMDQDYHGDFAPLSVSAKQIIASLNDALSQIAQSADQVTDGSGQVSDGAQALSQGTTEQASSVEELAATISEISSRIKENAQDASAARDRADRVGSEMTQSNLQMQDLITAMSKISESSSEIGKIIKTIEDIAFQTNILALNAAVEAARAGAAGKGFAVVADEVRNLANKSQEASKNTSALIENSIRAVEEGTKIAGNTATSLLSAVEGAGDVVKSIDRISSASGEQADAVSQITLGVEQISAVVQTNSATAEESAAASEELSGQAQIMKGLVGRFRLRSDHPALESAAPAYDFPAESYAHSGSDKY